MQTKCAFLSLVMLLAFAAPLFANPTSNAAEETRAVEQAVAEFYTSLNALFTGETAPMKEIWSHADDVTYMGPAGGFQVGWEQVSAIWEAQAALNLGGKVEPSETKITIGEDLAIVSCFELGNNLNAAGEPEHVSIRATNIFRKEDGQWKMIGHHTDLLPFLSK